MKVHELTTPIKSDNPIYPDATHAVFGITIEPGAGRAVSSMQAGIMKDGKFLPIPGLTRNLGIESADLNKMLTDDNLSLAKVSEHHKTHFTKQHEAQSRIDARNVEIAKIRREADERIAKLEKGEQ